MNLPYSSTRDLVVDIRKKYFQGFYVLPYNRFDIDHSQHWWLSPTCEKAAFKYGKAIFTTDDKWVSMGCVFCGFNVEKGVPDSIDPPGCVMKADWFWHRFLELAKSPLVGRIEEASKSIGSYLQLFVSCGIIGVKKDWSRVLFDVEPDGLNKKECLLADSIFEDLALSKSIDEFGDAIRALHRKASFHWVDVIVGTSFSLNPTGPDDLEKCAAMLRHFQPWMMAKK